MGWVRMSRAGWHLRVLKIFVLASRRGLATEGASELKAELERLGADVSVVGCDVRDRRQLSEVIESLPAERPLDAVFHAAGVEHGDLLNTISVETLQATLAPKAQAALHLHELTQHMNLSAFVLFSSMVATTGSAGSGGLCRRQCFPRCLAEHRQGLGLPATSVAWGMWAGAGMVHDAACRRGIPSPRNPPDRARSCTRRATAGAGW